MNYISKLDRINIKGIHVFAASGVLNYKSLLKSNKYIFDLTEKIENTIPIEVIDLGGGSGKVTKYLIDNNINGICYDFSEEMMKNALSFPQRAATARQCLL